MARFGFGFGFNQAFRRSGVSYNTNAQLLFDTVGDVPLIAKQPISDLYDVLEASGVYSNPDFYLFISVPSLNVDHVVIEIKSLTTQITGSGSGTYAPPYAIFREYTPTVNGIEFNGDGFAQTGFVPSVSMTLNNSCEVLALSDKEVAASTYNCGAYNSNTQTLTISRNIGGQLQCDHYSTTNNAGRNIQAGTDDVPVILMKNRTGLNFGELVKNKVVVATATNTQNGTLPNVEVYLNKFNNNGVPTTLERNQSPIWMWGSLGSGVNSTNRNLLANGFESFQNSLQRNASFYTRQVILDGNSHCVYWHCALYRGMQYYSMCQGWRYRNFGISAQQTSQLQSDFASQVATKYDASLTENWYIPNEATNDLAINKDLAGAQTRYQTLCETAQAAGFKVLAIPIMCRKETGAVNIITAANLLQDAWNQWLVANWSTFADAICPISSDTFIWRSDYASDTDYNAAVLALVSDTNIFYDGVHLTEAAGAQWGKRMIESIN